MATVRIGGKEYETAPLKFKQLKRVYPLIQKSQELFKQAKDTGVDPDPIVMMEAAIQIVHAALEKANPDLTVERIEEEIDMDECQALQESLIAIITESGFQAAKPGEGVPPEGSEASPSTETLTA